MAGGNPARNINSLVTIKVGSGAGSSRAGTMGSDMYVSRHFFQGSIAARRPMPGCRRRRRSVCSRVPLFYFISCVRVDCISLSPLCVSVCVCASIGQNTFTLFGLIVVLLFCPLT